MQKKTASLHILLTQLPKFKAVDTRPLYKLLTYLNKSWWCLLRRQNIYSRICLIRHFKPRGLEKSDNLGQVTNYANRWKLYHRS